MFTKHVAEHIERIRKAKRQPTSPAPASRTPRQAAIKRTRGAPFEFVVPDFRPTGGWKPHMRDNRIVRVGGQVNDKLRVPALPGGPIPDSPPDRASIQSA
jgi:hypothetical protein